MARSNQESFFNFYLFEKDLKDSLSETYQPTWAVMLDRPYPWMAQGQYQETLLPAPTFDPAEY